MASSRVRSQTFMSFGSLLTSENGRLASEASPNVQESTSGYSRSRGHALIVGQIAVDVLEVERLLRLTSGQSGQDNHRQKAEKGGVPTHKPAFLFGLPNP